MKLEISLFRFDYKSDYLPYYTKNYIKIKNEKTLQDVLNTINDENPFEYRNTDHFLIAVNGWYTTTATVISDLVEDFGTDLTIEPISIRRAHTDLCINDADFKERLKVLSEFIDEDDIKTYNSYKIYFYASNTINYEYDYIGDPLLLLAYDLIQKDSSKEQDILEALKEYECGAQYHTSLKNRVYDFDNQIEDKVETIRKKLELIKPLKEQNLFLDKKNSIDFGEFKDTYEIQYDFEDFNIAYFSGLQEDIQTLQLLENLSAKIIDTHSMHNDLALESFHINSDFTMKLAATVMLDAFDNSADFLVVDCEDLFYLFDSNRKAMQQVSGRDIILPVIHKNELQKLAIGEHEELKKQLKKHLIDPEII